MLRDTDGDDVADEYQVVFTGLNNLRTACTASTGGRMAGCT